MANHKYNPIKTDTVNATPYLDRIGLVYVRVSDKKQEQGHGREGQELRCKQFLESINVQYEKSFIDTYTGAGDFMNRPKMRELLSYIDAHSDQKFVVVFDDLKRFARDVEFHLKLRKAFRVSNVIIKCLNYNFDESPEGQFVEVVLAAQGELERKQNARQVVQKHEARLLSGYWAFRAKKGYSIVKDPIHGKVSIPNSEAPLLKEALEGFSKGIFVRKLDACKFLQEKGIWTKLSTEKYIDDFDYLIRDPFYAGFIEYLKPGWNVTRRVGHHEAIISPETFNLNQKRLKKESLTGRIRMDINPDFYLRGLLICDHCSGHLTGAWSRKKFPYYMCHNKNCERYGKSVQKKIIEERFIELLQKQSLKTEISPLLEIVFERVWKSEIHSTKALELAETQKRAELNQKATQLTDAIFNAKSEPLKKVYETQLEDVANKLEELGYESVKKTDLAIPYRTALDKATTLLKSPYSIWERLDTLEQHRLFYFIFEQKLPYNQFTGYRTDKITTKMALFEGFLEENSPDVDLARVELASPQCECGVLPLYYKPKI